VLVIGGSAFSGGPIRIAAGSKSRQPNQGEIALVVDPEDCEPAGALHAHTRFRVNEAFRIAPEALSRRICELSPEKLKELDTLRQHGL
jgi:hypothetical protein